MSHSHPQTLSPRGRRLDRRSPSKFFGTRSRHRPRFDVMEDRTLLSTFLVNTTADSGPGSLRQAILDSNAATIATNTIDFNISASGVQTIAPLSPLPPITHGVLIDGFSQPGYCWDTTRRAERQPGRHGRRPDHHRFGCCRPRAGHQWFFPGRRHPHLGNRRHRQRDRSQRHRHRSDRLTGAAQLFRCSYPGRRPR